MSAAGVAEMAIGSHSQEADHSCCMGLAFFPFLGFGPHLGVLRAYPDSELRSHKEATMWCPGRGSNGGRTLDCAVSEACISLPF